MCADSLETGISSSPAACVENRTSLRLACWYEPATVVESVEVDAACVQYGTVPSNGHWGVDYTKKQLTWSSFTDGNSVSV